MSATVVSWLLVLVIAAAANALHDYRLVVTAAVWLAWLIGRLSMLPRFQRGRG